MHQTYFCFYPHPAFTLGFRYHAFDIKGVMVNNDMGELVNVHTVPHVLGFVHHSIPFREKGTLVVVAKISGMGLTEGKAYPIEIYNENCIANDYGVYIPLRYLGGYVESAKPEVVSDILYAQTQIQRYQHAVRNKVMRPDQDAVLDSAVCDFVKEFRAAQIAQAQAEAERTEGARRNAANERKALLEEKRRKFQEEARLALQVPDDVIFKSSLPTTLGKQPKVENRSNAELWTSWNMLMRGEVLRTK